jgi:kinetochore protein NNF1
MKRGNILLIDAFDKTEFSDILDNRNVVPSLNALDRLIADAKGRKDAAEADAPQGGAVAPVP